MSPHENVRFRGKRLGDLTRDELLDALYQALAELKRRDMPTLVAQGYREGFGEMTAPLSTIGPDSR